MKKKYLIIGIVVIVLFLSVFGISYLIKTINYHKTYEYKFIKLGYTKENIESLNKLNKKSKNYILSLKYDKNIILLINEKYFIEDNLQKYIEYKNEEKYPIVDIIALINTNAYKSWYSDTKPTDKEKGNLMLTNKFNYLDSSYNDENMVKVSKIHSFGENQMLTSETYEAFKEMFNAAKSENLNLIINSSFRSYEEQESVYNLYKNSKGEEEADKIAAKPGFSEHQTGLSIDIQTYGSSQKTFEEFDEFKWLQENAYKYGFILRYPKDKEYITGYQYESWHYRYVGKEVAQYIHDNNITFDEYYAYFIERSL